MMAVEAEDLEVFTTETLKASNQNLQAALLGFDFEKPSLKYLNLESTLLSLLKPSD